MATSTVKASAGEPPRPIGRGLVEMLLKVASHPQVNIASIAVQAIPLLLDPSNSIVREVLPILQRRAIIPHDVNGDRVDLQTESYGGVSLEDFLNFREHVLTDALVDCWKADGEGFFDSCTSAVEEFCAVGSSIGVSLFLEAAIFCIEAVGSTVMSSHHPFTQSAQLKRCTEALAKRPASLLASSFTLARMACMIRTVRYIILVGACYCQLWLLTLFVAWLACSTPPGTETRMDSMQLRTLSLLCLKARFLQTPPWDYRIWRKKLKLLQFLCRWQRVAQCRKFCLHHQSTLWTKRKYRHSLVSLFDRDSWIMMCVFHATHFVIVVARDVEESAY